MGFYEMTVYKRLGRPKSILIDTHILVWHVEGDESLGIASRFAIDEASNQDCLWVSAITPWEIGLLVNKGRLKLGLDVMAWIHAVLAKPGVRLVPLEPEIAVNSTRLPFEMHGDPADRILVATARHLGASLVTADRALLETAKQGHFSAMDASI
jgi:PIN domain nuclease of toxin-antitoxin system